MNTNKKRRNKRKSTPLQSCETKYQKTIKKKTISEASCSNVTSLSEAKGTVENRSFSELDYDIMSTLFKGSDISEVARILNDSPLSNSEFDKPLPLSNIPQNHQSSSSLPLVGLDDVNNSKTSLTACASPISKSVLPIEDNQTAGVSVENQPPVIKISAKVRNNVTDHASQNKMSLSEPHLTPTHAILPENDLCGESLAIVKKTKDAEPSSSSYVLELTETETSKATTATNFWSDHFNDHLIEHPLPASIISESISLQTNQNTSSLILSEMLPKNNNSQPSSTAAVDLSESENNIMNSASVKIIVLDHIPHLSENIPTKVLQDESDHVEGKAEENEPSSPSIMTQIAPGILNNSVTDSDVTNCESPFERVPSTSRMSPRNNRQIPSHSPENHSENHDDPFHESEIDDSDHDPNYADESNENKSTVSSDDKSSSKQSDDGIAPRTRKKKAGPSKWKRNVSKLLRNSGQQYISQKKGSLVSSREMGPPCNDSCRLKCSDLFLYHERKGYFDKYWALNDINKQRSFIVKSIQTIKPKYRYPQKNRSRKYNHAFYFYKDENKVRVCKNFFVSTLGITNRCIRTTTEKLKDGFLSEDQRGKHHNHVTVPESVKNEARNHIASIPTIESHCTRADTSKNYIEGGRSLMDIYRDYKKECQREHKDYVSFSLFRQIFNYEFNLEFFKPKKDLCQFCESYKNKTQEERLDIEIEYIKHHEEKNLSRAEKEEDKKNISSKFRVACFDLQAALPTPKGEVSTFYYKSKLSTYNFTVCELNIKGLGIVNSYLWHEGEGHKGSNEICSSLLHYLEHCAAARNAETASGDSSYPEVVFYSDNCGGQCKNKFIIAAYLYAVSKLDIKSITHKFLVVGHTQNEGDVSHSLIEKNIKKALKSSPIYLPSQYATLISTARKYGEPFVVHELENIFFYDLKDLVESTASNFNINDDGERFNFNDICVIRVEKDQPGVYLYKTSYKDEEYQSVNVTLSRTRRQLKQFQDVQLKKAYTDSIPISQRKYRDLMSLVASNTIPRCHSAFYESLIHE